MYFSIAIFTESVSLPVSHRILFSVSIFNVLTKYLEKLLKVFALFSSFVTFFFKTSDIRPFGDMFFSKNKRHRVFQNSLLSVILLMFKFPN